jgi:hypothetical protein
MKNKIIFSIFFALMVQGCTMQQATVNEAVATNTTEASLLMEPRWASFFSGHDLDSFVFIGDDQWSITDNYVEATSGNPKFLVTTSSFRDIEIYAEFWTSPEANSGIFIRCQDINNIAAGTCYEVNIFDQRPDQSYRTGGIVNFAAPMAQQDAANRWNTYRIISEGERIVVYLNDELMVDIQDDAFFSGPIAFQWSAGTVRFRNIRFRPL